MDFHAWFEAYLGGRWYTFDARHNVPRIGRVKIAHGRDAVDVALSTSYGAASLESMVVWSDEIPDEDEAGIAELDRATLHLQPPLPNGGEGDASQPDDPFPTPNEELGIGTVSGATRLMSAGVSHTGRTADDDKDSPNATALTAQATG
jgi:hypothetical protein